MREQFISKGTLKTRGIQSDIEIGEVGGKPAIRKVGGKQLTDAERALVVKAIPKYREDLRRAGVNIPDNYTVRDLGNGVETVDALVDGKTVFEEKRGLVAMLRAILKADEKQVFMDGKRENFVNHNDDVTYVDTFPPMLRGEDGKVSPWVESLYKRDRDMMSFNFGDVKGQATKMLALARREDPENYERVVNETLAYLKGNVSRKDYQYIKDQAEQGYPDMTEMYANPGGIIGLLRRITGK